MRLLPPDLAHQFDILLEQKKIDSRGKATYFKWLRFYWDFCQQSHYDAYRSESLPPFLDQLREQRPSELQQPQARQAMTWFYHLQPNLAVTLGGLAPREKVAAVSRNPDAALKSVVLSSKTKVENAATSITHSIKRTQLGSQRTSQPDSHSQ